MIYSGINYLKGGFFLDKKKVYTLIMAFLMAGSIFSFSFFFGSPQDSSSNQPPEGILPNDPSISNPTALRFEAQNVPATVEQLFPTMFVTARTNEPEISKIDLKVSSVGGVKRVNNSFYRQNNPQELAGPLIYIAELSVESNVSREQLAEEIGSLEFFSDSTVFSVGLVSLPRTVVLSNPDLNLTQEHTFSNPASQAYLNIGTVIGDEISVSLETVLVGKTMQNLLAAEENNLTGAPKIVSMSQEFELSSLENTLVFTASTSGLTEQTSDDVSEKLRALEGISGATVSFSPSSEPIEIIFSEEAKLFQEDLETFFSDYNGVTDFDANAVERKASVFVDSKQALGEFVPKLRELLDSLDFTVQEIIVPDITLEGQIHTVSIPSQELVTQLKIILEESGVTETSFLQKASVKASELTDPNSNETFEVEGGEFEAQVSTERRAGETVSLDIFAIASRGKIGSISASKAKKENNGQTELNT